MNFLRASLVVAISTITLALSACTERTILSSHDQGKVNVSSGLKIWLVKASKDNWSTVAVNRPLGQGDRLEQAIKELLRGATTEEMQMGLASEIPRGTILLGIKEQDNNVELNLSKRFAYGGGSDSLTARIEQLQKTVSAAAGRKKVYLDVEGQRMSMTGEGLEIPQPLN